jgi:Zn finger protein HypA/HybF involved in hydrogenase expression
MHEVSLVERLIEECVARAHGGRVERVRVRYATTIPVEGMRQAFEMLSQGTSLERAVLEAEPFEVTLACACGFDGVLGHDDLISASVAVCPACGDVSTRQRTAELELLEVS